MKNKKQTIIILILTILMLIMMLGCSIIYPIIYPNWLERIVGYNGICWYDSDHVLVYCNLTWYYTESTVVGNSTDMYKWQGELWKCDINTGEKELMMRGNDYWIGDIEDVRISVVNGNIYINDEFSTYKVKEDYNGWDSITQITYPIVSSDENYIVGLYRSNNDNENEKVIKFNKNSNISETIYINPDYWTGNPDLIKCLDYDYSRNYLLVNSNKFIDLNTGEEKMLTELYARIDKYIVTDFQSMGKIGTEYITMDSSVRDTITDERYGCKIKVEIQNTDNKQVLINIKGIINSDSTKYASGDHHSISITDIVGNQINSIIFDSDKL